MDTGKVSLVDHFSIRSNDTIMNVLICEDDKIMLKALEYSLLKENYNVVTADDGKKASILITKNDYDLIITDINMPYYNGLEIINLVKNELNKNIPVIVITSVRFEKTIMEAFELGADDYVVKPFSPSELIKRIKRSLGRKIA